jgi:hypothetical protein
MQKFFDVIQARSGDALANVTITVYNSAGNPATLYSDNGVTVKANPTTTNADGEYSFYAANGTYSLTISNPGYTTETRTGVLLYDAADGSAATLGYNQGSTGAVTTTVQKKLNQTVSVFDFMTAAQIADVQAGTASIDCLAAFVAAKNSFLTVFDNFAYSMGGTINVPPGKYYLSNTFIIDRNIKLIGAGAPFGNDGGSSQLVFANNCDGILAVDYRDSPNNKQGTGLVIQDLGIGLKTTGSTVGSGVSLKTTARLINLNIGGWGEHGIKIDASTGYSPASNANNWYISGCTTSSNKGNGLFVKGADANAGVCYSHNSLNNLGWGIYDASFLGNTYVGCHTDSNTMGAFKSDGAVAVNVFLGCYSESGQPASSVIPPSMIVGGTHAAGVGSAPFLYAGNGGLYSSPNFGSGNIRIGVNQSNNSDVGLTFLDTAGFANWTFQKTTGKWYYKWANSDASPNGFIFYDRSATIANGYPRSLSGNNGAVGISDYYFGTSMKVRALSAAAPTDGTFIQGDIFYNTSPTAGGFVGWVCTTSGTFGTLNSGATTGGITSGTNLLVVNSATGLTEGCFITIAGVSGIKTVQSISGLNITLTSNANATVSGAAVAFSTAVFKTFGAISA